MGDLHGAHRALIQVLTKANFNYDKDTLIFLGDICDGWDDVHLCIEEFLKIKTSDRDWETLVYHYHN